MTARVGFSRLRVKHSLQEQRLPASAAGGKSEELKTIPDIGATLLVIEDGLTIHAEVFERLDLDPDCVKTGF